MRINSSTCGLWESAASWYWRWKVDLRSLLWTSDSWQFKSIISGFCATRQLGSSGIKQRPQDIASEIRPRKTPATTKANQTALSCQDPMLRNPSLCYHTAGDMVLAQLQTHWPISSVAMSTSTCGPSLKHAGVCIAFCLVRKNPTKVHLWPREVATLKTPHFIGSEAPVHQ